MQLDLNNLTTDMGNLEREAVLNSLRDFMASNPSQAEINAAIDALSAGMSIVGERYDRFEYFIGDLIFAGMTVSEALDLLMENQAVDSAESACPQVLLCTVEGDLHSIGKTIVKSHLQANRISVLDLGVNISSEEIAEVIRDNKIRILALSGVMKLAAESMRKTISVLEKEGLRDSVKIVLGGPCASNELAEEIGADAYASLAEETVTLCQRWLADHP